MQTKEVVVKTFDGKEITVVVGEISWLDAQKLIGESTEFVDGRSRVNIDKLRINLVKYAIKDVKGIDLGKKVDKSVILEQIPVKEGNKVLKVALELNPLEQILEV